MKAIFSILTFTVLLSSASLYAQQNGFQISNESIIKAVKQDVWTPFLESYRDLDIQKMLSIQDPKMTRVSIDKNSVETSDSYFKSLTNFFDTMKSAGYQMNIEFSIISTAVSKDKVYQTGYYTVNIKPKNGQEFRSTGYSFFTVLLIQKEGKWKITLDADKKVNITKEKFESAGTIYKL